MTNGLISFRREPWVPVVFDAFSSLIGYAYDLRLVHPLIEKGLARDECKAIISFFNATKRSLESTYDTSSFNWKIKYVPLGLPQIPEKTRTERKGVNIVFVGSINYTQRGLRDGWFYNRGGHMVVRAFQRLRKRFDHITLTIRSQLPDDYRMMLERDPRVRIVDYPLSYEEYDDLLWASDIFLLPMRDTPEGSFLDAMNHALPVITTHTCANAEVVQDGKWGFVCEVPTDFNSIVDNFEIKGKAEFNRMWKIWTTRTDSIVNGLVDSLQTLILNEELRRKMGRAGRETLNPFGQFSVERRNEYLKRVLDEATA